ncbi:glycine/D-amino acid oxidase [Streptomyces himastatinicus ATCC 53653]|uniref:Glycine/D-amino acid oxidase n=1 Tax=Streptomyces himastatinicus ATCC 53653 TaxID=457427 RepID=D9WWG8_9ACTN|nr:FAD-dependent oxidoreductase [Streptomyces himastatinicus]EFL28594.1 glycine/D-amino acid oxidase [Streptomyces himastatinicus ATCC 53653]
MSATTAPVNGRVAHWFAELPAPRPALPGDRDADVCVVGAGMTGLWTAYYLKKADPSLRVMVLEAEFAGFGASGRNGGWASGLIPGARDRLARTCGRDAVLDWQQAMNEAVDEIIAVAAREGIDADIVKGGTLRVARTPAQATRLRHKIEQDHEWGVPESALLTPEESARHIAIDGVTAGAYTPHCARLQPAALVRGLAETVERLGVTIYEKSPVTAIEPGRALTAHGTVSAPVVLRATEGFTASLKGLRRAWLPMNSSMIVTEPLPEEIWKEIGWEGRETLGDTAHGHMYAQRTPDDRIAIGGRGVPYRFGSRTDDSGRVSDRTIGELTQTLQRMLPQTTGVRVDHAWCGVLAVPRDWSATVGLDRATGVGWAGGYVGHGGAPRPGTAARTLTDLVIKRDTRLTRLPWTGHRPGTWEPEPFRWLGVRGLYVAYRLADRHEAGGRTRTSPIATVADLIARRP